MESVTDSSGKMKLRNNLQLRFIISFTVFAMIITGVYALVMEVFKHRMAEEFFQRRIQAELDYFAEKYQQDPNTPLPIAEDIQSYLGTEKMPKFTQFLVKSKRDGVYDAELDPDDYYDELLGIITIGWLNRFLESKRCMIRKKSIFSSTLNSGTKRNMSY